MRLEFKSGTSDWVVDTDLGYLRSSDIETGLVFKESTDLGMIVQLEDCRLAFYEDTYGHLGVTVGLPSSLFQQVPGLSTDVFCVKILWSR
jgi:hypothetical protein